MFDVDVAYREIGDKARTAGGKLRKDIVGVKRVWTIRTRPMPLAQAEQLLGYLRSTNFAEDVFVIAGLATPVLAYVDPMGMSEEVVAFGEDGVWHNDGRQLTLVIEEV